MSDSLNSEADDQKKRTSFPAAARVMEDILEIVATAAGITVKFELQAHLLTLRGL
jgi:hypothetical protein